MTLALFEAYLVRPTAETVERFGHAWFGGPQIWRVHQTLRRANQPPPDRLKLQVLGRIHDDAYPEPRTHTQTRPGAGEVFLEQFEARQQANAAQFLAWAPLTLATFDRCWTIEDVFELGECDSDRLSVAALAAVLPTVDADVVTHGPLGAWSLRESWHREITHRERVEARAIAALREAIARLLVVHADDLPTRACVASGPTESLPPRSRIDALLQELGCVSSGPATLHVALEPGIPTSGSALTGLHRARVSFRLVFRRTPATRRKTERRGRVEVAFDSDPESDRVTSAVLVAEERVPL